MAKPQMNVDVEYGTIEIAGVWYTIAEVHDIIDRLNEIMEARDWQKEKDTDVRNVYIDLGIMDDTIVYQIKLKQIGRIPGNTSMARIIGMLKHQGITNAVVDPSDPRSIDMMNEAGIRTQRAVLRVEKENR